MMYLNTLFFPVFCILAPLLCFGIGWAEDKSPAGAFDHGFRVGLTRVFANNKKGYMLQFGFAYSMVMLYHVLGWSAGTAYWMVALTSVGQLGVPLGMILGQVLHGYRRSRRPPPAGTHIQAGAETPSSRGNQPTTILRYAVVRVNEGAAC